MKKWIMVCLGLAFFPSFAQDQAIKPNSWRMADDCEMKDGVLCISSPSAKDARICRSIVSLKEFAGKTILISGEIKAENVSRPEREYNGIKFGIKLPGEKPTYHNATGLWGTYDWEETEIAVPLPREINTGELFIGLQGSSGSTRFRNIRLRVLDTERTLENQDALNPAGLPISLSSGGWQFCPEVRTLCGGNNAVIEAAVGPGTENGQFYGKRPFDFGPYLGKKVYIDYEIKAEAVSKPAEKWWGIKVMFTYDSGGMKTYVDCEPEGLSGTFDWKKCSHTFVVPEKLDHAYLYLGLQNAVGKVQFRNLRIRRIDLAEMFPSPVKISDGFRCEYSQRIADKPVLRGVMSPMRFNADDFAELKKWNVNLIRWQLAGGKEIDETTDMDVYRKWLDGKLSEFDSVLAECRKYRIGVILDLHSLPGGRYPNRDCRLFFEKKYLDVFLSAWQEIARRYRGNRTIYAYDLINEPQQTEKTADDYLAVQYRAAKLVREIDPDVPIVIEANMSSTPSSYQYLQPLPLKDLIYQIHSYYPGAYTHQGVYTKGKYEPVSYPNSELDQKTLRRNMESPRAFQLKYGARMYVGEFSAIRWAPGADRYINDAIGIFEEYGWDWTFHAFREWNGWSVEHTEERGNNSPADKDTARKNVLLNYFRRNLPFSDNAAD